MRGISEMQKLKLSALMAVLLNKDSSATCGLGYPREPPRFYHYFHSWWETGNCSVV